jgi:hypothetical protein
VPLQYCSSTRALLQNLSAWHVTFVRLLWDDSGRLCWLCTFGPVDVTATNILCACTQSAVARRHACSQPSPKLAEPAPQPQAQHSTMPSLALAAHMKAQMADPLRGLVLTRPPAATAASPRAAAPPRALRPSTSGGRSSRLSWSTESQQPPAAAARSHGRR